MQTNQASITINAVAYCAADIAKAAAVGISVKPNANEIVDQGDALVLPGFRKTALFRTEGVLKVVARGDGELQGYVLLNKHSLKKTHTAYEPVYVPPAMADERREFRRDERDTPHRPGGFTRSPFGRNTHRAY